MQAREAGLDWLSGGRRDVGGRAVLFIGAADCILVRCALDC